MAFNRSKFAIRWGIVLSHFAKQADLYAKFRPDYPKELFQFIASIAPGKKTAWDCATGNGQAAFGLAERFSRVLGTDASSEQISHARVHPRVEYRVAMAEASGLQEKSVDAITVCQALHWLDLAKFFAEVERVLVPGGVLAVTVYAELSLEDSALNPLLEHFKKNVVAKYWPPERKLVDEQYRSIKLPFEELSAPSLALTRDWTLEQLVGYLRSWSATVRYIEAKGADPTEELRAALAQKWENSAEKRRVAWPFTVRACRVGAA